MYYYFETSNNMVTRILTSSRPINTRIMRAFREMTSEQQSFYLEHPNASTWEVWNCQITPTPTLPEPSIEEQREQAIVELDQCLRSTLTKAVDVLSFCDAVAGTIYSDQRGLDSVYSDNEILSTADDFLLKGKQLRDRLNISVIAINSANSTSEIRTIVESTEQDFQTIIQTQDNLEKHKRDKIRAIDVYDISENVNGFFLNGNLLWLDKATRTGLVNTLNSATIVGREHVSIWFSGMYITLNIEQARQLLAAIEIYATDCYNVTAQHKVNVQALTTTEAVDAYDYTTGYPQRLEFTM